MKNTTNTRISYTYTEATKALFEKAAAQKAKKAAALWRALCNDCTVYAISVFGGYDVQKVASKGIKAANDYAAEEREYMNAAIDHGRIEAAKEHFAEMRAAEKAAETLREAAKEAAAMQGRRRARLEGRVDEDFTTAYRDYADGEATKESFNEAAARFLCEIGFVEMTAEAAAEIFDFGRVNTGYNRRNMRGGMSDTAFRVSVAHCLAEAFAALGYVDFNRYADDKTVAAEILAMCEEEAKAASDAKEEAEAAKAFEIALAAKHHAEAEAAAIEEAAKKAAEAFEAAKKAVYDAHREEAAANAEMTAAAEAARAAEGTEGYIEAKKAAEKAIEAHKAAAKAAKAAEKALEKAEKAAAANYSRR